MRAAAPLFIVGAGVWSAPLRARSLASGERSKGAKVGASRNRARSSRALRDALAPAHPPSCSALAVKAAAPEILDGDDGNVPGVVAIAVMLYDGFDELDALGPYEVFRNAGRGGAGFEAYLGESIASITLHR